MSSLEQLQPLLAPPAVSLWPPAPGWWLLAILLPLLGLALWHWRHLWPVSYTHLTLPTTPYV